MTDPVVPPALSQAEANVVTHRGTDLQVIACAGSGTAEVCGGRLDGPSVTAAVTRLEQRLASTRAPA